MGCLQNKFQSVIRCRNRDPMSQNTIHLIVSIQFLLFVLYRFIPFLQEHIIMLNTFNLRGPNLNRINNHIQYAVDYHNEPYCFVPKFLLKNVRKLDVRKI